MRGGVMVVDREDAVLDDWTRVSELLKSQETTSQRDGRTTHSPCNGSPTERPLASRTPSISPSREGGKEQ